VSGKEEDNVSPVPEVFLLQIVVVANGVRKAVHDLPRLQQRLYETKGTERWKTGHSIA
jgi:hypothetical protein